MFKRFKKTAKVSLKVNRCDVLGCEQVFRSKEDRDDHVKNGIHCMDCGFGFAPSINIARPLFCLACSYIDNAAFTKERTKII